MEKAREMKANGQVSPKQSPHFRFYFTMTHGYAAMARIRRIQCGRFCRRRRMGPTTAESPTRALGNNCGTVTGGRGATVALFHPSAAAHAASSTRGSRLKMRARAAPHEPSHITHDQRKTRAHDQRLRAACEL